MRAVEGFVFVTASLHHDAEDRRWYAEAAEGCVVLTRRRRLLEPDPLFGPTHYRLLACRASVAEARSYALSHGFPHERDLP